MQRPLMFLIIAFMIGIIGATIFKIEVTVALLAAVFTCVIAGVGIIRAWHFNAWVLFCVCLTMGIALTSIKLASVESPVTVLSGEEVSVIGVVADRPDVRPQETFYKLEAKRITHQEISLEEGCVLRVKVKGQKNPYQYGDIIALKGLLNNPEPPGNPGAFDYREWLTRQGITATISVNDVKDVRRLGREANQVFQTAFVIRDFLENILDRTMTSTRAAVLKGLLFGTRGEIPADIQQAFNESGLVHILSVSGFHVSLIAGLVITILHLLKIPNRYTAWVAIPILIFYAFMTGLGPAVSRSTIMAVLLLLAHHLGRQQDWPTTLSLAAGIILVGNPLNLFDIGFQLSFAATWGLLYLTTKLNKLLPNFNHKLALLITVPLGAQLATLPLVVLYFNLVSPVSILANLLTVHLVAIIMLFGGIALVFGLVYLPLAAFINVSTGLLTDLFLWLVQLCSSLPAAAFYIPAPPLWLVILYYVLLVGIFEYISQPEWRDKVKQYLLVIPAVHRYTISIGIVLVILITTTVLFWSADDRLELHFIDVGQGDSTLIITPAGRTVLVDAGGWKDELITGKGAGDYVVVPYLHRLGINQLDVLVITHPHADHAGGVRAVIRAMPVKLVVVSPYGLDKEDKMDQGYDQLLKDIQERGVKIHAAERGDQLKLDPALQMTFLSPTEKFIGTRSDANNNSLVLLLSYLDRTVLLTGDIEREAEEYLISENISPVEILKVPHHGSGYFHPDFFAQVKPRVAVISVGKGNSFGHPANITVDELTGLGSRIYRTDQQGAIVLSTIGDKWSVHTGK